MKILWCITGAGEFLKESLEAMAKLHEKNDIEVFVSKAGEEKRLGILRGMRLRRRCQPAM